MSIHHLSTQLYEQLKVDFTVNVIEDFIDTRFIERPISQIYSFMSLKSDMATKCFVKDAKLRGQVNSIIWKWVTKSYVNYEKFQHFIKHGTYEDVFSLLRQTDHFDQMHLFTHETIMVSKQKVARPKTNHTPKTPTCILDIVLQNVKTMDDLDRLLGLPREEKKMDVSPPASSHVPDQPPPAALPPTTCCESTLLSTTKNPTQIKPKPPTAKRVSFGGCTYQVINPPASEDPVPRRRSFIEQVNSLSDDSSSAGEE